MDEPTPIELLNAALQKNELLKYIKGEGVYYFANKWVEVPTDLNTIFIKGFNEYIIGNEDKTSFFHKKLDEALQTLTESPIGCWWCISILYSYYYGYIDNALIFKINVKHIIPKINISLSNYKSDLIKSKDFVGWRFEKGLWEDIINIVPKLNEKIKSFDVQIVIDSYS